MRYRLATPADLKTLRILASPGFEASRTVQDALLELWGTLLADGSMRMSVIEDPALPAGDAIRAFGASVFVTEEFAETFLRNPHPGLAGSVYEQILGERSPVLSPQQVREANSGEGLHLVMLHFGLANRDLSNSRVQEVMFTVNTAFFFFYGGYRLKSALQEVHGRQAAEYMQAGGFHVVDDFGANSRGGHPALSDVHPYLLSLRKEQVQPSVVNPLSFLFYPVRPSIYFWPAEQALIERALLNQSDLEISQELGISTDAIKKTWRRAYYRASKAVPYLFAGGDVAPSDTARGTEKRRELLEYVRVHPEELRPYRRVR